MTTVVLLLLAAAALVGVFYLVLIVRGFVKSKPDKAATSFPLNFHTPQGALRMYHDAVKGHDLEAMVAAKDFEHEAAQLLRKRAPALADDQVLVRETKLTLEAAFRAEWQGRSLPDLSEVQAFFSTALPLSPDEVFVNELLLFPDGRQERSPVYLKRRGSEWRLFQPPP